MSSVLKVFNTHLMEFADDISRIVPDDTDIKATKVFLSGLGRVNPRAVITAWRDWIIIPYSGHIDRGDFRFFVEKDYSEDVGRSEGNSSDILQSIESMRTSIRGLSSADKEKAMKYVQNLTKLCRLYFSNSK